MTNLSVLKKNGGNKNGTKRKKNTSSDAIRDFQGWLHPAAEQNQQKKKRHCLVTRCYKHIFSKTIKEVYCVEPQQSFNCRFSLNSPHGCVSSWEHDIHPFVLTFISCGGRILRIQRHAQLPSRIGLPHENDSEEQRVKKNRNLRRGF